MGWTSENVAKDFHVTTGGAGHLRRRVIPEGRTRPEEWLFSEEIVPFTVLRKGPDSANRESVVVREDDGIRYGTTADALSKIKSAFPQWGNGTTTGGNASQITDGAAAVLVMTRREAERRCLPILGKHIRTAVTGVSLSTHVSQTQITQCLGVPPRIMGIGPVYAIPLGTQGYRFRIARY
jgi:acetyl-CoA acyltransferase 1